MKTGSIYKRPGKGYIIFGSSKTVTGLRIASEPFINISEAEANVDALANAVKASLCNDDTNLLPHPKDWKEFDKIFLQKIGLKSLKLLDNPENRVVLISENNGVIAFDPMQPAKRPDKGFVNTPENKTIKVVNTASNQEIVAAYEMALDCIPNL